MSENEGDIYISGSNAKLLSSELATLLSGRYIEIPVYPLTFKEFLDFRNKDNDKEDEFQKYLRYGGMPGIHFLPLEDEAVFGYLNSLINTVLYKDIIGRYRVRDSNTLDRIVKYLFDNIGNITTAKKIADYFKSQKVKVSVDTVLKYMDYIESSMILERVSRYDLKGKKILEFYDKIFLLRKEVSHENSDCQPDERNRPPGDRKPGDSGPGFNGKCRAGSGQFSLQ